MGLFDKLRGKKSGGNDSVSAGNAFEKNKTKPLEQDVNDITFDKKFSEIQADMVDVCLEFCNDRADKIFIYGSCEEGAVTANFFYQVNGRTINKHLLNDVFPDMPFDVSKDRQLAALDILVADVKDIGKLCEQSHRDTPTEIKMIYTVASGAVEATYKYDLVYTNTTDKFATDIFDEWFNECGGK
jgi:hypothetical protein